MACWSRQFIELYHSLDCVWNVKSKEYNDRQKKAHAYDVLVAKVRTIDRSATRDTVVKKINCLRSAFRKEMKKVIKSKQSGGDQVYVPRLWYYKHLSFLEGHELPKDNTDDEDEDKEIANEPAVECETIIQVKRRLSADESSVVCTPPISDAVRPTKKRCQCSQLENSSDVQLTREDRFDIIGKVVATKLRILPNQQRIYAEKLINDVLFEAELNNLGRGCHIAVPDTTCSRDHSHY